MNSKTGFGSLIGKETGEVVAFGTRKKRKRSKVPMIAVKSRLSLRRQWSLMSN